MGRRPQEPTFAQLLSAGTAPLHQPPSHIVDAYAAHIEGLIFLRRPSLLGLKKGSTFPLRRSAPASRGRFCSHPGCRLAAPAAARSKAAAAAAAAAAGGEMRSRAM